jgi:RNA polymerase sigma-70 factor (ECF subfamily)
MEGTVGTEISFKEIYEEFHPKILRYLSRLAGQDTAEDIAQEVFEKVSRSLGNFRGDSKISTWIYRIATNKTIDRFRSPSVNRLSQQTSLDERHGVEDHNVWTGQSNRSTDGQIIKKEMSECVHEYVDRLKPEYRAVILLSEIEGLKNREIADVLQVSLDTVKIRLHRARTKLKNKLDAGCDFYQNEQNTLACDRKQPSIMPKMPE